MQCNPYHRDDPGFSKLYVFGAGGAGREVVWLAEQSWGRKVAVEFVVDQPNYLAEDVNEVPIKLLGELAPETSARYVVAIGDPTLRRKFANLCRLASLRETLIVHPRAEISRWVTIGEGTVICAGAIVTTNIRIGKHVYINIDCSISHDVIIGDYVTLSPGVHISGHVHIGEGAFVGTGAKIINGSTQAPLIIGMGAVIAAGACVISSVECGALMAGVPATRKR
jgi:sugar O-acyltransferase (sialic acid O-acetyltransferase NeuD family)